MLDLLFYLFIVSLIPLVVYLVIAGITEYTKRVYTEKETIGDYETSYCNAIDAQGLPHIKKHEHSKSYAPTNNIEKFEKSRNERYRARLAKEQRTHTQCEDSQYTSFGVWYASSDSYSSLSSSRDCSSSDSGSDCSSND